MYEYFGHGFQTLSVIKHLKAKIFYGLISASLGVLDVKRFENHQLKRQNEFKSDIIQTTTRSSSYNLQVKLVQKS